MKLEIIRTLTALLIPSAAWGSVIVSAGLGGFGGPGASSSSSSQTHLHASVTNGSNTSSGPGSLPGGCGGDCAKAEADGSTGRMKGRSEVSSQWQLATSASHIEDNISFGPNRTLSFRVAGSLSGNPGSATMDFTVGRPRDPNFSDDLGEIYFSIAAWSDESGSGHSIDIAPGFSVFGVSPGTFNFVPTLFDFDLTIPPGVQIGPVTIPYPDPMPLFFHLRTSAVCVPACTTASRYDNTVFIGIASGYTSSNGYSYLGVPGGGTSAIPEPSTALLWLGAAGLMLPAIKRHQIRPLNTVTTITKGWKR